MQSEHLIADELSARINCDVCPIRGRHKDRVQRRCAHDIGPFGGCEIPSQMRHTAATLWLASVEAPEWVARQLGHASTQMLFQVYSRYVPNMTRQDGSAIDRLLATRFATGNAVAQTAGRPGLGRPSANSPGPAANDSGHIAQPPPAPARLAA